MEDPGCAQLLHLFCIFLSTTSSKRDKVPGEVSADVIEYRVALRVWREILEKKSLNSIYSPILIHQDLRVQGQQQQSC